MGRDDQTDAARMGEVPPGREAHMRDQPFNIVASVEDDLAMDGHRPPNTTVPPMHDEMMP